MFQIKRPKPGETEEDLLREQEKFLKSSGTTPAATVVRKPDKRHSEDDDAGPMQTDVKPQQNRDVVDIGGLPGQFNHTTGAPPVKKSKFKERQEEKKKARFQYDPEIDSADSHITQVLTEIVERDIQNTPVYYPTAPTTGGFPIAPHRGNLQTGTEGKSKKSIFGRQFASGEASDFGLKSKQAPRHKDMEAQERKRLSRKQTAVSDRDKSNLISGSGLSRTQPNEEAKKIHDDNTDKLASMTQQEILSEQQKLVESLDPSLLAFLKSRNKTETKPGPRQVVSIGMGDQPSTSVKKDIIEPMETTASVKEQKVQEQPRPTEDSNIPVKPEKKWVNMDVVEEDKLNWTKDLPPPPKADYSKTGQPARFDFNGNLLSVDADIPTNVGLHHHGDEPERAGYTLEELFQLARSANMQQRVVALTTIGRILKKARDGSLYESVQTAVIPALLDGGLVFILRWALDDSTDNTMAAAVQCLHALLVCPADEAAADRVFNWHQGFSLPALQPDIQAPETEEEKEEKQNETDAMVLKQDIIKALLKMQILQRLRYILEVWKPAASVVLDILQILTRFVRHSPQVAYEVMQCPRLIDVIFKEFLPTTWTPAGEIPILEVVHGYPVPEALKLIRVICAAGKNMAASLVSKYWLMTCISRYIAEDPSDLHLPLIMASNLQVESLRVWQIISRYGLASSSFTGLYPVIMKSLQSLPTLYHMSNDSLVQWASATLGLLESTVCLAATAHHLTIGQHRPATTPSDRNVTIPIPEVNWSQVSSLYQPILFCLEKALKEFVEVYPTKKQDLTFASSCMNFISTFISKVEAQPGYNALEWIEKIEALSSSLQPFLTSPAFKKCLDVMRGHSALIWVEKVHRREVTMNLPELGALVSDEGGLNPILKDTSTIPFILALTRLLYSMGKINKDIPGKIFHYLLCDEDLVLYLRKCCQAKQTVISTNTFVRFENFLQYYLVQMARYKAEGCDTQLYHQVALLLLSRLHQGDEHIAHDLMSSVIFNPDLIRDITSLESGASSQMEQLRLGGEQIEPISSAAGGEQVRGGDEFLARDITQHLASIRASHLTAASPLIINLQRSRARILGIPYQTDNLLLGTAGQLIAPVDWPFMPLVELYNRTSQSVGPEDSVSPQLLSVVTDTLRFIFTLEKWRPRVLESVSFVTKFSRLMCTFLAGSDLFLDSKVHLYLESVYKIYCRPSFIQRMDFNKKVPGLVSFYDFFIQFLMQYEAVSFGDGLFGSYILLPIQQQHDVQMRKAIWTEHTTILRNFSLPLVEVPLPLENFLHPDERNVELIRLYYRAIFSASVTSQWSPLFYLIAVHHVNRFIYSQDTPHQSLRKSMMEAIHQCKSHEIKKDLLYYKDAERTSPKGINHYEVLPTQRKKTSGVDSALDSLD